MRNVLQLKEHNFQFKYKKYAQIFREIEKKSLVSFM